MHRSKVVNLPSEGNHGSPAKALCFLILAASITLAASEQQHSRAVPQRLKTAVGCLVAAPFIRQYGLKPLGLKAGDWAWVRYHVGSVIGLSATPHEYYVAIYSPTGERGVLLLAIPNEQGGFEAVHNGYHLKKIGCHWVADGGSGGYGVYQAMGRLANQIAKQPRYRVLLSPGGPRCTEDK